MRNITQDIIDVFSADIVNPILLAEFDFDSQTIGMWTGYGTLTWGEKEFFGGGNFIGVSAVEETQDLRATGLIFQLNGISTSLISAALTERVVGRACRLYIGSLNLDTAVLSEDTSGYVLTEDGDHVLLENQLVDSPVKIFSGLMDVLEHTDNGDTADLRLSAENILILLKRSKVRRYTPEDQKRLYPTDKGLDLINQLQDKEIVW